MLSPLSAPSMLFAQFRVLVGFIDHVTALLRDRVFAHRQRLLRECRAIEVVFALFNQLRDLLAGGLEAPDACFAVKVAALA